MWQAARVPTTVASFTVDFENPLALVQGSSCVQESACVCRCHFEETRPLKSVATKVVDGNSLKFNEYALNFFEISQWREEEEEGTDKGLFLYQVLEIGQSTTASMTEAVLTQVYAQSWRSSVPYRLEEGQIDVKRTDAT